MQEELWVERIKFIVAAIGSIVLFVIGRLEYLKTVKIRRAEFLDKLITDFLDRGTEIARYMLDDYVYVKKENRKETPIRQKELAIPLKNYLRNHNIDPIGTEDEIIVRKSFDRLLDFFAKLSYYKNQNLITANELQYFKYYLNKIYKKEEVIGYIKTYFEVRDFKILFNALELGV